jgi:alpha/beta superfamily hydrolase
LIYDKRGVGSSTGDWRTSSFEDLAKDALAAVEYLKTKSSVISSRTGVMGSSQGGWIAPITASLSPDIAFVVLKSGPGVTPEAQELARTQMVMQKEGDSPIATKQAVSLYREVIRYARTRQRGTIFPPR